MRNRFSLVIERTPFLTFFWSEYPELPGDMLTKVSHRPAVRIFPYRNTSPFNFPLDGGFGVLFEHGHCFKFLKGEGDDGNHLNMVTTNRDDAGTRVR
jgi:hypothetical protein